MHQLAVWYSKFIKFTACRLNTGHMIITHCDMENSTDAWTGGIPGFGRDKLLHHIQEYRVMYCWLCEANVVEDCIQWLVIQDFMVFYPLYCLLKMVGKITSISFIRNINVWFSEGAECSNRNHSTRTLTTHFFKRIYEKKVSISLYPCYRLVILTLQPNEFICSDNCAFQVTPRIKVNPTELGTDLLSFITI